MPKYNFVQIACYKPMFINRESQFIHSLIYQVTLAKLGDVLNDPHETFVLILMMRII